MEIFADTANLEEIQRWLDYGVIDGVTTNPSIMLAEGAYKLRSAAEQIAALLVDRPLSIEVIHDEPEAMLAQAREIAEWADNIVLKIPVITSRGEPCLGVINALYRDNIKVNATACMSFGQAMLAAKAGATYVSLFAGRMSDEGIDAPDIIQKTVAWLKTWDYPTKIIVGSIREAINVQDAALAGAHVITVPPKFLRQLVDHKYSRFTVGQFIADGQQALERLVALELEMDVEGDEKRRRPGSD